MKNKKLTIWLCILFLSLVVFTIIYALQDVKVRVILDKETLIRNGQSAYISFDLAGKPPREIKAATPHYSIYEYIFKIPASVWQKAQQGTLQFSPVRDGDLIFIKSISVKTPFYTENTIINDAILENPHYDLPILAMKANGAMSITYAFAMAAITTLWAVLAFAVPIGAWKKIPIMLRKLWSIIRKLGAMDIAIILAGVPALVLYHFRESISFLQNESAYHLLFILTVLSIIISLISAKQKRQTLREGIDCARAEQETKHISTGDGAPPKTPASAQSGESRAKTISALVPYLTVLLLALTVYWFALIPEQYYHNDEWLVRSAAYQYLRDGAFTDYDRAWPHTWLVAQAIKFFADTVVTTRAVSALCGVVFIITAYHIALKMTKKKSTAFLTALFLLLNPALITIFTFVRMYALMLPASLWMLYCVCMTLNKKIVYKKDNAAIRFMQKHFNFHWGYAIAAIVLIWLNYQIHINTMILAVCAIIYVFLSAIIYKERKFIYLSIVGFVVIAYSFVTYYAFTWYGIYLNMSREILPLMNTLMQWTRFGQYNYEYFWENAAIPLGAYLGVLFLIVGLAVCVFEIRRGRIFRKKGEHVAYGGEISESKGEERNILLYLTVCYLITVTFFIYFADMYYAYRYMSFLAPVTMMLISIGCHALAKKAKTSTRFAIYVLVAAALLAQMGGAFRSIYVDSPDRSQFNRPCQIMVNDVNNEGLTTIQIYAPSPREYYWEENMGKVEHFGRPQWETYQIDRLIEQAEKTIAGDEDIDAQNPDEKRAVMYFFSESDKMWHISGAHLAFLETATEMVTDIDDIAIYKYHFVKARHSVSGGQTESSDGRKNSDAIQIINVLWDNDIAYLSLKMSFIPEFADAKFIAIEITEQGSGASAAHRYQVIVPDDFSASDELVFSLSVRPKTAEHSEDITFSAPFRTYVYYGEDNSSIVG